MLVSEFEGPTKQPTTPYAAKLSASIWLITVVQSALVKPVLAAGGVQAA